MRTTFFALSIAAAFALTAGCSAKSSFTGQSDAGVTSPDAGITGDAKPRRDGGKPTSEVTAEEACDAWVSASCAREEACSDVRFKMAWGDESTCSSRKKLGCVERFGAAGVTATPKDLAACAEAMADLDCQDLAIGKVPDECDVAGTRDKGEGCADGAQCASGYCRFSVGSECGTCAERGKAFASCSSGQDCAPGLLCSGGRCAAPVKQGEFCGSGSPCVPWLTCSQGECLKGAPAGASCGGGGPSDVYGCDAWNGVVCNSLLMSCTAVTVRSSGAACDPLSDVCGAGAECSGGFGFGGGTCEPAPREGDACFTTGSGPSCLWPSVCANGECALPSVSKCD